MQSCFMIFIPLYYNLLTINYTNSINITQYTSAQSILFLSKATCFGPYNIFRHQMLCPLWDPTVFTVVEYILVKTF